MCIYIYIHIYIYNLSYEFLCFFKSYLFFTFGIYLILILPIKNTFGLNF